MIIRALLGVLFAFCGLLVGYAFVSRSDQSERKEHLSFFDHQALLVCHKLHDSEQLYHASHFKEASQVAEAAYWNIYDNVLEIKYRSYATPGKIFSVENSFHQLSSDESHAGSANNIANEVQSICQEVKKESAILNHH